MQDLDYQPYPRQFLPVGVQNERHPAGEVSCITDLLPDNLQIAELDSASER